MKNIKHSKLTKKNISKYIEEYNNSKKDIYKITDLFNIGDVFNIISHETMDTSYGPKIIVEVEGADNTRKRIWANSDIQLMVEKEPMRALWNDPCFSHFRVEFKAKLGNKYLIEIQDIVTNDNLENIPEPKAPITVNIETPNSSPNSDC